MPTFLSLFAGLGGLDLALEAAGFTCLGQVENDPACIRVLERFWPTVPRWGDVREFGAAAYGYTRRGPDLIAGGFPCQPVSHAGQRKAQADDRWLWPEFARIARELQPRWILLENVPGLLSAGELRGAAFAEVLSDLAQAGFDAEWTSVRASEVGACHRRERIFLLAERTGSRDGGQGSRRAEQPGQLQHQPQRVAGDVGEPAPADAEDERWERTRNAGTTGEQGQLEPPSEPAPAGSEFPWGPYAPAITRWEAVMGTAPAPVDEKGRLATAFVEWMQAFPPGWTGGLTRTRALKALGNAVVWPQAFAAISVLASASPPTTRETKP